MRERRDATPEGCQFNTKSDLQTAFITRSVAQKILDLTGLSPYVVIAGFDRKYIDANRPRSPVNCAFTDADARPFYDEYHKRIAGFVEEIRVQNDNRGFLIDIHGKIEIPEDPADIYLGTDNGGSLLPGFDRASIFMQHGLHGLLKSVRRANGTCAGARVSVPSLARGRGSAGEQFSGWGIHDSALRSVHQLHPNRDRRHDPHL